MPLIWEWPGDKASQLAHVPLTIMTLEMPYFMVHGLSYMPNIHAVHTQLSLQMCKWTQLTQLVDTPKIPTH